MTIIEELEQQVKDNPVLLYMKGSPDSPQCGFSSKASQILIQCGKPFSFVDILSNPEIRANLPQFSNWPTFPQLFVNGELVGGCDIITELHEAGELQAIIDSAESQVLLREFFYYSLYVGWSCSTATSNDICTFRYPFFNFIKVLLIVYCSC